MVGYAIASQSGQNFVHEGNTARYLGCSCWDVNEDSKRNGPDAGIDSQFSLKDSESQKFGVMVW
ncbi:hypothetical protein FRB91_008775 [Serendipita sp. 411]|nr:hypothetical protein FRC15_001533 [Serendipita sp. 397]KAG8850808.1 hypothetical protein FRB91_008775 [Serendipita sp. 411]KAG8852644.1 hypothetical protein FRC20_001461 [Serendipita sp. 405]